jgi:putative transposase
MPKTPKRRHLADAHSFPGFRAGAIVHGRFHYSDRGTQYLSIRYSERLAECGIQASVGTTGDSYDNALAESIIGLYKTEVIRRRGPWRNVEVVEFATLDGSTGLTTAGFSSRSATYHPQDLSKSIMVVTSPKGVSGIAGAVQ